MRLIDAEALVKDFSVRAVSARNWKERAIMEKNEEAIIRADATLAFLSEVKLTIDNTPTVERPQGDLISRMWLKEHKFTTQVCNGVEIEDVDVVAVATIDNAPTVEPQKIVTIPPELIEKLASCVVDIVGNIDWEKAIEAYKARPQGKWIYKKPKDYVCSCCGYSFDNDVAPYCWYCGADMRGGRE